MPAVARPATFQYIPPLQQLIVLSARGLSMGTKYNLERKARIRGHKLTLPDGEVMGILRMGKELK